MKYSAFKQRVKGLPVFSASLVDALTDKGQTLRVQLSVWKRKGLIVSLRKGLYVLGPEERQLDPSLFFLANQIFSPSYVSLESALHYHGLIPEFVAMTTSVTVRKTCRFENDFGVFTYRHILPEAFNGFESIREHEKGCVLIAAPEKAVADFLYLNLTRFRIPRLDSRAPSRGGPDRRIFVESYRFQNCEKLAPRRLKAYAKSFRSRKLLSVVDFFLQAVLP